MRRRLSVLPLIPLLLILSSCNLLGQPTPETFNQKLEGAYRTAETVVRSSSVLLNAHKISSADSENAAKQADVGKQGLDVARQIHTTDPQAGNDRLVATLAGLRALEAYLKTKE